MEKSLTDKLREFLAEDLGYGDITTSSLVESGAPAVGYVVCREDCVVAGIEETRLLLEKIVNCKVTRIVKDGTRVKAGTVLLNVTGPAEDLLRVERTMLNLISHMSGVATSTHQLVKIARKHNSKIRIAATRKTLPGLRYFEKKAVEIGGGDTHRSGLDDMVLIKDNHLAIVGSIEEAIKTARSKTSFTKKIEIEVTRPVDAVKAVRAGADIVLLDNMKPKNVMETVELLEKKGLRERVTLEASGGISRENIEDYAKTGVDVLSVGRMTSSAKSIDMSLELKPRKA